MPFKYNPFTSNLDLITNPDANALTGVTSSNSIAFSVVGGNNVTGSVNLSASPADSNNSLVNLAIKTDGLQAEIPNSLIQSAALNLQGPVTLLNNNIGTAITYPAASASYTFIDYSINRGTNYACGRLLIVNNTSSATLASAGYVELSPIGVSFGVAVSGGNIQIQYSTTNTGINSIFKYSLRQWS